MFYTPNSYTIHAYVDPEGAGGGGRGSGILSEKSQKQRVS